VDLDRQRLARIEQLEQDREPLRGAAQAALPEDFPAVLDPQSVEVPSGGRARGDHTLGLRRVDDLPQLADRLAGGEVLSEAVLQSPAAPHAGNRQRREDEGFVPGRHQDETSRADRPTPSLQDRLGPTLSSAR